MKNLLLILTFLFLGCNNKKGTLDIEQTTESVKIYEGFAPYPIKIIRFQGCEYMYLDVGDRSWGSHMGNCDNPIHLRDTLK